MCLPPTWAHALIEAGADINKANNRGTTLLHLAIRKGSMDVARLLMRQPDLQPSTERNDLDQQILFLAVGEGRLDFVNELLTHNTVDPNQLNENGETLLHIAIANGNAEILEALLKIENEVTGELEPREGVLVNERNRYGETPLMYAVEAGNIELIEMLLADSRIDIDVRANEEEGGNNTALMIALKEGDALAVKAFVEASQTHDHINLSINAELEDGKTALMLAAERGYGDCIRGLLKHPGIDINKRDASGRTALMLAMKEGNMYDALDAFFEHEDIGRMLNETDNEGNTALMIALEKGYTDSIRYFLNQKNKDGNTALMLALKSGNEKNLKSFIAHLGGVNAVVEDGKTLLMLAAEKGYLRGIEVLLKTPGIDVNQKDPSGKTAIELATKNKHFELLPLLRKGS